MNRKFLLLSPLGVMICCVGTALGQAGAPTQRVHIPGIPDGTSIYPKSANIGDNFLSIGCVTKNPEGEIVITDWRGSEQPSIAGAPPFAATAPLVLRLQGDKDMLNFHVGHEVQITGPIVEKASASRPLLINVESILYLSRTCWKRGATTAESAKPKP
jgi:hypothetical protein